VQIKNEVQPVAAWLAAVIRFLLLLLQLSKSARLQQVANEQINLLCCLPKKCRKLCVNRLRRCLLQQLAPRWLPQQLPQAISSSSSSLAQLQCNGFSKKL
jgi:hypothetical protein